MIPPPAVPRPRGEVARFARPEMLADARIGNAVPVVCCGGRTPEHGRERKGGPSVEPPPGQGVTQTRSRSSLSIVEKKEEAIFGMAMEYLGSSLPSFRRRKNIVLAFSVKNHL